MNRCRHNVSYMHRIVLPELVLKNKLIHYPKWNSVVIKGIVSYPGKKKKEKKKRLADENWNIWLCKIKNMAPVLMGPV